MTTPSHLLLNSPESKKGAQVSIKGLYLISSGGRVVQDLVEKVEDGELEQQGVHLEAEGQTVEHPDDAVVGVGSVFGVGFQQEEVGKHNGRVGKPVRREDDDQQHLAWLL